MIRHVSSAKSLESQRRNLSALSRFNGGALAILIRRPKHLLAVRFLYYCRNVLALILKTLKAFIVQLYKYRSQESKSGITSIIPYYVIIKLLSVILFRDHMFQIKFLIYHSFESIFNILVGETRHFEKQL